MTTRILTGTYNAGYTLSASFTGLSIASSGAVTGVTATGAAYVYNGGDAVLVTFVAPVTNAGTLLGGMAANGQPAGGMSIGGSGGTGGAGADLTAGGTVINSLAITGGHGGYGGEAFGGGHGGAGGSGVLLGGAGKVNNTGTITGGAAGGAAQGTHGGTGGTGGAGVQMNAAGTVTNGGVIAGGAAGNGAYGTSSNGGGGTGGAGIDLVAGGVVLNTYSVFGGDGGGGGGTGGAGGYGGAGVTMSAVGTVTNKGLISGGQAGTPGKYYIFGDPFPIYGPYGLGGAGVAMGAGGLVNNTGRIFGGGGPSAGSSDAGVYMDGAGTVANSGTIIGGAAGGAGVLLKAGGRVSNSATIFGGSGGVGVLLSAGGVVANSGHIAAGPTYNGGGAIGVALVNGGTLNNTGVITGAAGVYSASYYAGFGVTVAAGGSVINGSKTATTAAIFGYAAVEAGSGGHTTVTNFGTIAGAVESVFFGAASDRLIAEAGSTFMGLAFGGYGGTLETAGGSETLAGLGGVATMTGAVGMTFKFFGTYQIDAGSAWTLTGGNAINTGQILIGKGALTLAAGASLTVADGGTVQIQGQVANGGTISLSGTTTNTDLRVLALGATLSGGGVVAITGTKARILGISASARLTNLDNTIEGDGNLGTATMALTNQAKGTIAGTGSATLTINTGTNTIANLGTIISQGTGSVVVRSAVANSGRFVASSGTLALDGAVSGGGFAQILTGTLNIAAAFGEQVNFMTGSTGQLRLTDFTDFTGIVNGFSKTGANTIDLWGFNIAGAKASYSGAKLSGVLTVTNGAQTAVIQLNGNYSGQVFNLTPDGHGGTEITDPSASTLAAHMAAVPAPAHMTSAPAGYRTVSPTSLLAAARVVAA